MNPIPRSQVLTFISRPPRSFEWAVWFFLVAAIIAIRVYLWHLLPFYLWSKDATSYAASAWQWLDHGKWVTDPRRGSVYSLLIAGCLKAFGSFNGLIIVQHILGGAAVLGGMLTFRRMHGARALLPLAACGWAYAVYAGPLSMEHLVRNETLILLFATGTLSGWWLALHGSSRWLWLCGISAGLLALTKSVFVPFPVVAVAALLWLYRKNLSQGLRRLTIFLIALALPFAGAQLHARLNKSKKPREPQSGLLLFGRVAQFTVLDGGIEPEIKALIRPDIEDYRRLVLEEDDLDNNIPLNRTAVPHMRAWLLARGKTPSDLNDLCRSLALEAIRAHPRAYLSQAWNDFSRLHLSFTSWIRGPASDSVLDTKKFLLAMDDHHPTLQHDATVAAIDLRMAGTKKDIKRYFNAYREWVDSAWLFQFCPVLLTSLLLPFFIWKNKRTTRWWWLTCAALWYFNAILLSTVGKPMDRYMIPVMPIMFWTLGSAVAAAWLALLKWLEQAAGSREP